MQVVKQDGKMNASQPTTQSKNQNVDFECYHPQGDYCWIVCHSLYFKNNFIKYVYIPQQYIV